MAPDDNVSPEAPEPPSAAPPEESSPAGEELQEEEQWQAQRQKIPLKVDVDWLDFEHFKNRYSDEEGLAIIEVLCGHPKIAQEVAREQARRKRGKQGLKVATAVPNLKHAVDGNAYWIQRVRIQSPQIILLLSRLTGHRDGWTTDSPRTFFAPFLTFYYYLPQLKRSLELLEQRWTAEDAPGHPADALSSAGQEEVQITQQHEGTHGDGNSDSSSESDDDDIDTAANPEPVPTAPERAVSRGIVDSRTALAHLRKFVDFIERYLVPHWSRAAGTSQRKFRFNDLWMAFQPGELLHKPVSSEPGQNSDAAQRSGTKMYQTAWRLYSIVFDRIQDDKPDDIGETSTRELDIHAYYWDYDGTSYIPVIKRFSIKHYEGDKDITSLEVFPLRFAKDSEKLKDTLSKQGTMFLKAVRCKHLAYDGWTLTRGPTDDPEKPLVMEHVDSDVIIDFAEGYKSDPLAKLGPISWERGLLKFDDSDWPVGDDELTIRHWKSTANGRRLFVFVCIQERTQRAEWYCERFKNEVVQARAGLRAYEDGKPVKDLDQDERMLLPRRLVGYAFRERRFVMLDIQSLRELPASDNVFRNLRINPAHKNMVISLVKSHLDKQALQRLQPRASLNQDLVRGKGSGLVLLLHGVPGVGKTATAEAVAQAYKRPLFVITCGDLGFDPQDVESGLKNIFRLAHLWDCILLLDEADIFLSRRELKDLERNALVSVFLRVLEYYSGILFLTTNRVGDLDEAFKSRIHISLYYPPLDRDQTLSIFQVNIGKLERIVAEKQKLQAQQNPEGPTTNCPRLIIDREEILDFARRHFDRHEQYPEQRWNGRQIRNAFQIAYSLAEFEMIGQNEKARRAAQSASQVESNRATPRPRMGEGRLGALHFEMVAEAIEKFETYLFHATTMSDRDRARKTHIRHDDYVDQYIDYAAPHASRYQQVTYQKQRAAPPAGRSTRPSPGLKPPPSYRTQQEDGPRDRPAPAWQGEQPTSTPTASRYPPRHMQAGSARPEQRSPLATQRPPPPRKQPGPASNTGALPTTPSRSVGNAKTPAAVGRNDSGYGSGSGWSIATPRTTDSGLPQDWQNREGETDGNPHGDEGLLLSDGEEGDGGLYDHKTGYSDADPNGVEENGYDGDGFDGADSNRFLDDEDDAQFYGEDYRYAGEAEQVGGF
ncbi:hypothetical protein N657DRAFT_601141 [Parathielavia appendiculata]|uniref:AAA+ ATPase domain-containing protein n=1 Tax=Parathielavia appendiculata TaxID=2587402 RepID=A0AAN6TW23_9PEZI|nr:hypothetical protein N657DRAFT_601141 [Parathielavia appendiculata]